jgi:hypothetical protein
MYGNDYLILGAIISIALIITFFVIAYRLGKILNILEFFRDIELKNPENWITIKCEKCSKEFKVAKTVKGTINCPECKAVNRIPGT